MRDAPDFRPIDPVTLTAGELLALRRQVERIHALGPRAVQELLIEIINEASPQARRRIVQRVEVYARIDGEILSMVGGDRSPAVPLRMVR